MMAIKTVTLCNTHTNASMWKGHLPFSNKGLVNKGKINKFLKKDANCRDVRISQYEKCADLSQKMIARVQPDAFVFGADTNLSDLEVGLAENYEQGPLLLAESIGEEEIVQFERFFSFGRKGFQLGRGQTFVPKGRVGEGVEPEKSPAYMSKEAREDVHVPSLDQIVVLDSTQVKDFLDSV